MGVIKLKQLMKLICIVMWFGAFWSEAALADKPPYLVGEFVRADGARMKAIQFEIPTFIGFQGINCWFIKQGGEVIHVPKMGGKEGEARGEHDCVIDVGDTAAEIYLFRPDDHPVASRVLKFDGYRFVDITSSKTLWLSTLTLGLEYVWGYFVPIILFGVLLVKSWRCTRQKVNHVDENFVESNEKRIAQSRRKAIFGATGLFLFDAILLNQGVLSALIGLYVIVVGIPLTLASKDQADRKRKWATNFIWLTCVVAVLSYNWISNKIAVQRANEMIEAVKAFRQQHGAYPKRLDDLVPAFLPAVPRAKYVPFFGEFKYLHDTATPALFYVEMPPFGRPTYRFGVDKWGYVD